VKDEVAQLWVHQDVQSRLHVLPPGPCEVGGWLLGYWTADEKHVVVTHATPPSSRGTPWGVEIDGAGHISRFNAAWEASDGQVTFLGDWHTHPGGRPLPSERDRKAMRQLAGEKKFGTPSPLIAIVETPRWPWRRTGRSIAFFLRKDGAVMQLNPRSVRDLPEPAARISGLWP
jgi:integrative and conjugative element protein (TIGR02256 family)